VHGGERCIRRGGAREVVKCGGEAHVGPCMRVAGAGVGVRTRGLSGRPGANVAEISVLYIRMMLHADDSNIISLTEWCCLLVLWASSVADVC
jgi:hypothetical protein